MRERGSGRTVQLGSSCVRAYTGADRPQVTLRQAEAIAEAGGELTAASRAATVAARDGDGYLDTVTFLAHAAAAVRSHRFVAASAAPEAGPPTWRTAAEMFTATAGPAPGDIQRAREIRAWVAETGASAADGSYESGWQSAWRLTA